MSWRRFRGGSEHWSGWCNGSAGYVFLFTLASKMLSHPPYLEIAAAAAENTWSLRNPNDSLCCGATGDGYAYLNLFRATGSKRWLQRARRSAERAMKTGTLDFSLFGGRAGIVALLSDLERPENARMPLFERAPTDGGNRD